MWHSTPLMKHRVAVESSLYLTMPLPEEERSLRPERVSHTPREVGDVHIPG